MSEILLAAAIVGGTGLILGLFLGLADKKFKVETDEKVAQIRAELPGNNCGGCGYAGCDAAAAAIAAGEAKVSACPVGGAPVAARIAAILGKEAGEEIRKVAFVKCSGTCGKTHTNFDYYGVKDCSMMAFVPGGGPKSCDYGCLGYGSCVAACQFDAIHVIDGVAVVDREACKGCGACISKCPQRLIELVPYELTHLVACSSRDKGKAVMQACETGCIGCKKCEKECPAGAITVTDQVAHVDVEKCENCGRCAAVCPRKVITGIPAKP